MKKEVKTEKAPQAIGPYSQGIIAPPFVFCSGQIPLDPATGQVVEGGIEDQTRQVLKNVSAVLEAAGSSLDRVVKTTVFLQDMNDFAAMNNVYAEFFPLRPRPGRPSRSSACPRTSRSKSKPSPSWIESRVMFLFQGIEKALQVGRQRGFEFEPGARFRMAETDFPGMEKKPRNLPPEFARSVDAVAGDGMPAGGHVDADLMRPPRMRPDFDEVELPVSRPGRCNR